MVLLLISLHLLWPLYCEEGVFVQPLHSCSEMIVLSSLQTL